ncbi:MAG TPA: hypothetical protein VFO00_06695, partial [Vitreimonas sp.]|nr:hypothetical protein [Vitreimonas sp.]
RAERAPGIFALIGPTQHDVREVMVDGPSGLRNLPGRERPAYERSRRRLLWAKDRGRGSWTMMCRRGGGWGGGDGAPCPVGASPGRKRTIGRTP